MLTGSRYSLFFSGKFPARRPSSLPVSQTCVIIYSNDSSNRLRRRARRKRGAPHEKSKGQCRAALDLERFRHGKKVDLCVDGGAHSAGGRFGCARLCAGRRGGSRCTGDGRRLLAAGVAVCCAGAAHGAAAGGGALAWRKKPRFAGSGLPAAAVLAADVPGLCPNHPYTYRRMDEPHHFGYQCGGRRHGTDFCRS